MLCHNIHNKSTIRKAALFLGGLSFVNNYGDLTHAKTSANDGSF